MPQFRSEIVDVLMMFSTITLFLVIYAYVSDQDYHDLVDTVIPIKYNCDMLIGGWHPDFPPEIIKKCRKKMQYDN